MTAILVLLAYVFIGHVTFWRVEWADDRPSIWDLVYWLVLWFPILAIEAIRLLAGRDSKLDP